MDIKSFWPELGPSIQEASVYFDKYKNKKIILKYGGQVMSDQSLSKAFAQDAAILRKLDVDVAVIHGGGPQIKTKLEISDTPEDIAQKIHTLEYEYFPKIIKKTGFNA